jgi:hypothetical protein
LSLQGGALLPSLWLFALVFMVKAALAIKAGVVLMQLLFIADVVVATLGP